MVSISKTVGRRVKLNEIWNSGIVVIHIYGIFDLAVFKVIVGVIRCICLKWPVSQIRMVIEQSGVKFGTRGYELHA